MAGETIVKIMALDAAEFRRSLACLVDDFDEPQDNHFKRRGPGDSCLTIALYPLEPRTMGGLLKLPRMRVEIAFGNCSEEERRKFLSRFDRVFQRGGG